MTDEQEVGRRFRLTRRIRADQITRVRMRNVRFNARFMPIAPSALSQRQFRVTFLYFSRRQRARLQLVYIHRWSSART
jgi:hypothetical protein